MIALASCLLVLPFALIRVPVTATQYHTHEGRINASSLPSIPFGLFCHVIIDGPSTSRYSLPMNITMFHDGGQEWAWRFTPDVVGDWQWRTECDGYGLGGHKGTISSAASQDGRLGAIIRDPAETTQLIYESGKQYTVVGLEVSPF